MHNMTEYSCSSLVLVQDYNVIYEPKNKTRLFKKNTVNKIAFCGLRLVLREERGLRSHEMPGSD